MNYMYKLFMPAHYEGSEASYQLQKQLPYIGLTTLFLLIVFILLVPLMLVSGAAQSTAFIVSFLVLDVLLVFSLYLLKNKKHIPATYLIMFVLVCSSYLVLFLMPYNYRTQESLYRPFGFITVMAAVNALVSIEKRQIVVFYIGVLFGIFVSYGTVYRDLFEINMIGVITVLATSVLGLSLETLVLYLVKKLTENSIKDADVKTKEMTEALGTTKLLLQETQLGMNIGEQVLQAGKKVSKAVGIIDTFNRDLNQGAKKLLHGSNVFSESNQAVNQSTQIMAKNFEEEVVAINETTAAITQILSNIESISTIAQKRRVMLDELGENSKSQQKLMGQLGETVEQVKESSAGIQNFVQTIEDIAGRTSLLSMNASIEAARAGASGKGFSVIAQEIRSLSVETEENATVIKTQLANNSQAVQILTDMIAHFSEFLETSLNSNQQLIEAIEEILLGIGEMNLGSREVLTAVQQISSSAEASKEEIATLLSQVQTQQLGFKDIKQFSEELYTQSATLEEQVEQLQNTVNFLHDSGEQNKAQIKNMQEALQ